MTIQEDLQKFLNDPNAVIVNHGDFKVRDYQNIRRVLEHTEDDFLIFKNGQGTKFEITFDITQKGSVRLLVNYLLQDFSDSIYSYQLDSVQTILNSLNK